ncbi:transposase [Enterococcus faecium]|nr:transposase [Enterococcus faecium]
MNDFTTEILKTLANKGDLNELFRVHYRHSPLPKRYYHVGNRRLD